MGLDPKLRAFTPVISHSFGVPDKRNVLPKLLPISTSRNPIELDNFTDEKCICNRKKSMVCCKNCMIQFPGRLSKDCELHPNVSTPIYFYFLGKLKHFL